MARRRLERVGILVGLLLGLAVAGHGQSLEPESLEASWYLRRHLGPALVLQGGDVIDVRSGEIRRGLDVHVRGDRIVALGPATIPGDAEVFDVSGRFLVPGLVDLHAHVIEPTLLYPDATPPAETLELLLDHGVTLARCLPMHSEAGLAWSARVDTGELVGPTLVCASGVFERLPQRTLAGFGDPATARAWVRKEALLGTRWIKVYNSMDVPSLRAIVDTARSLGLRVCGHTEEVPPRVASDLGLASIEHIISLPLSCSSEPLGLRDAASLADLTVRRWAAVDDVAAAELIDALIANGTGWVPTLVVSEAMGRAGHDGGPAPSDATRADLREALGRAARLAVDMHRRGGAVGTGTDFPVDGVRPGTSLHRELELLVELGGASPLEALRMCAWDSVRILGFEELLGALEVGRLADFLVLAENPLEDVRHLREIELVVHQGRLHEPSH